MSNLVSHKEYSARFGLKQALNDMDAAQQIAEEKYRQLVNREILWSEMHDINRLILEMRLWISLRPSGIHH
ncbi:MAG TPA: hypothetical protein VLF09_00550 [Cellvibrio sp.]|nr:hypothetical protein [Cellvibrio sp.]